MGGGTESLNDLRHRTFGSMKRPTKSETYHQLEHTKRALLHVLIWRAVDEYNIPRLELSKFVWIKEDNIMFPIHGNVYVTPNVHLQHVACGCKSKETCSCRSAKMPSTSYCKCKEDIQCANDNVNHIDQCDNSEQDCDEEWVVQQRTNARHLMNDHLRCY